MNDLEDVALTNRIKSGRRRLVAGGIIQVIAGVISALLAAAMLLASLIVGDMEEEHLASVVNRSLVYSLLFYGGITAWMITMGLGSLSLKRWARALTLVVMWPGFVLGAYTAITSFLFLPDMLQSFSPGEDVPAELLSVVTYFSMGMIFVIYIGFPGLLVLLYTGKRTREACEYYQPLPVWTDKRPLPVLAACFLFCFQTIGFVPLFLVLDAFPLFGTLVKGPVGIALIGTTLLLCVPLTWGFYQLRPLAWWGTLALSLFLFSTFSVTFFQMDGLELMRLFGFTDQDMQQVQVGDFLNSPIFNVQIIGFPILLLAFFGYTKRFFKKGEEPLPCPETTEGQL